MSDADAALMRASLDLVYKENAVLEERLAQVCPEPLTRFPLSLNPPLTSSCTSPILFFAGYLQGAMVVLEYTVTAWDDGRSPPARARLLTTSPHPLGRRTAGRWS
jgi:hypothetical protein